MKRDTVFVQEMAYDMCDGEGKFYSKRHLWLAIRLSIYDNHSWAMNVELFRDNIEVATDLNDDRFSKTKTMREVVHYNRVSGALEDYLMASAAVSCAAGTAEEIVNKLYRKYIVDPSLDALPQDDEQNWFKTYAPGTWDHLWKQRFIAMEKVVEKIQES